MSISRGLVRLQGRGGDKPVMTDRRPGPKNLRRSNVRNQTKEHAMSKVVALMSMSLDGYVADLNDGVAEVFDWYFSGDVEIPIGGSDPMTFRVSRPSAEHLHGLISELGAMLTGRRTFDVAQGWGGNHAWGPAFVLTHHIPDGWPRPDSTVHFITDAIETAVNQAKTSAAGKSSPRRRHHPAMPQRWTPRRNPDRHRRGVSRLRNSTLRPPRRHPNRPRQPDRHPRHRRHTPALPSTQPASINARGST